MGCTPYIRALGNLDSCGFEESLIRFHYIFGFRLKQEGRCPEYRSSDNSFFRQDTHYRFRPPFVERILFELHWSWDQGVQGVQLVGVVPHFFGLFPRAGASPGVCSEGQGRAWGSVIGGMSLVPGFGGFRESFEAAYVVFL